MKQPHLFDKIDLQLIRTLHTLLTERSVSKTAMRLGQQQPAVSVALKRLRELTGDPILVRSGTGMVPTDVGLQMLAPVSQILQAAEGLFTPARVFEPAQAHETFRIAASDTLDPLFLPSVMARVKALAPHCRVEVHALSAQAQYAHDLGQGLIDVVIGNWAQPSEELHRAQLFEDEVACLVSSKHPAVRRGWTQDDWLACEHIAPTPAYPGWRGVIDEHLDQLGLVRNISARCAHFGLMPRMVASSLLVLTTGRQYCQRFLQGPDAQRGLSLLPCPVAFPKMVYYQLWHERSHASAAARWLREQVKISAAQLPHPNPSSPT
ncbi:LysR family transcriptional regulator [Limnohabitans sp.]|jgi:DNA-binding transcriptional LysR family regulator|uniref:LysR family transcriptional regulator n=1 Tax=Limnohabitans sp. TaxID=1907725 RepID=UPI003341F881